jgi:hypothetical protein
MGKAMLETQATQRPATPMRGAPASRRRREETFAARIPRCRLSRSTEWKMTESGSYLVIVWPDSIVTGSCALYVNLLEIVRAASNPPVVLIVHPRQTYSKSERRTKAGLQKRASNLAPYSEHTGRPGVKIDCHRRS